MKPSGFYTRRVASIESLRASCLFDYYSLVMSDETNLPDNFEDKELLVEEVQPKEQEQQLPVAEGHETEVLRQQQEQAGGGKKTSTSTPKAIRLATISKLLDKQTTQINKIGQILQPLQRQLKSVEMRSELIKPIYSQLKQLQKQMSQVQKESQKIRLSLLSKKTSTKKKKSKSK
jgi:negative regulator of genetic competence, sporulation and motility